MSKNQLQANDRITENVTAYREAHSNRKALGPHSENGNASRAYTMQMDRASGALDVLHELFPTLPAWTETKWIQ